MPTDDSSEATGPKPKRGFVKGYDPRRNAGGRPKMPKELREKALSYAESALETLARLMQNRKAPSVAMAAATAILDRALGRPETSTALTGADGKPLFEQSSAADYVDMGRRIAFALSAALQSLNGMPQEVSPNDRELTPDEARRLAFGLTSMEKTDNDTH